MVIDPFKRITLTSLFEHNEGHKHLSEVPLKTDLDYTNLTSFLKCVSWCLKQVVPLVMDPTPISPEMFNILKTMSDNIAHITNRLEALEIRPTPMASAP